MNFLFFEGAYPTSLTSRDRRFRGSAVWPLGGCRPRLV